MVAHSSPLEHSTHRVSIIGIDLQPLATTASGSETDTLSNKPQWAILVEPKKSSGFFQSKNNNCPVVFDLHDGQLRKRPTTALRDSTPTEEVLVQIFLAACHDSSPIERVRQALSTVSSTSISSDEWLEEAVSALQQAGIAQAFDIGQFYTLAMDTFHKQAQLDDILGVPVKVDYPALLKVNQDVRRMLGCEEPKPVPLLRKKQSRRKFWFTQRPHVSQKLREVGSFERQDDPYGGLM